RASGAHEFTPDSGKRPGSMVSFMAPGPGGSSATTPGSPPGPFSRTAPRATARTAPDLGPSREAGPPVIVSPPTLRSGGRLAPCRAVTPRAHSFEFDGRFLVLGSWSSVLNTHHSKLIITTPASHRPPAERLPRIRPPAVPG